MIPDKTASCGITSPPYWGGVRDYNIDPTIWKPAPWQDFDVDWNTCPHQWVSGKLPPTKAGKGEGNTDQGKRGHIPEKHGKDIKTAFCNTCGVWKGPLGWENDPDLYIWHMVLIMREVWRVLRDDGIFYLNIGDCYAGSGGSYAITENTPSVAMGDKMLTQRIGGWSTTEEDKWKNRRENVDGMPRYPGKGTPSYSAMGGKPRNPTNRPPPNPKNYGLKPGDLVMIPHRLARALQIDGWTVRQDNVWNKKNPTPEPVKNRTTRAHEFIFQLTKSIVPQFWTHRILPGVRTKPKPDYRWIDRIIQLGYEINDEDWKETVEETGIGSTENRKARLRHFYDSSDKKVTGPGQHEHSIDAETDIEPEGDWRKELIPETKIKRWRRINLWTSHKYYYDADAIRTQYTETTMERRNYILNKFGGHEQKGKLLKGISGGNEGKMVEFNPKGANLRSVWQWPNPLEMWDYLLQTIRENEDEIMVRWLMDHFNQWIESQSVPTSMWNINTRGLKGAHFAVFPAELPQLAIRSSSSERGCCPKCGASWFRNTVQDMSQTKPVNPDEESRIGTGKSSTGFRGQIISHTTDWRPTCDCGNPSTVPCVVVDPFGGSFTTAMVADDEGRDWLSCDLNPQYVENVARKRIEPKYQAVSNPKIKAKELDW